VKYMYRVTREDTWKGYWHQPLVREVNQRSMSALVTSSNAYSRYKIVKIERAVVLEYADVTDEILKGTQS
jgi:hypothetical protein